MHFLKVEVQSCKRVAPSGRPLHHKEGTNQLLDPLSSGYAIEMAGNPMKDPTPWFKPSFTIPS